MHMDYGPLSAGTGMTLIQQRPFAFWRFVDDIRADKRPECYAQFVFLTSWSVQIQFSYTLPSGS